MTHINLFWAYLLSKNRKKAITSINVNTPMNCKLLLALMFFVYFYGKNNRKEVSTQK